MIGKTIYFAKFGYYLQKGMLDSLANCIGKIPSLPSLVILRSTQSGRLATDEGTSRKGYPNWSSGRSACEILGCFPYVTSHP
jgi:hypothetical protein